MPKTTQARVKYLRGFTLIELLVVIAIIGILAVASFALFGNKPALARDTIRKDDLAFVSRLLEEYALEHGAYPDAAGAVWKSTDGTSAWIPGLVPSYANSLPRDPKQTSYSFDIEKMLFRVFGKLISPVYAVSPSDSNDCFVQKVVGWPPQNIGSNEVWSGSKDLSVTGMRSSSSNQLWLYAYTPKTGGAQVYGTDVDAYMITLDTNTLNDGVGTIECRIQTGSNPNTTIFQKTVATVTIQNGPPPPPPPPTFSYAYQISADKKTYTLWGSLENTNDPAILGGPKSKCTQTAPPPGTGYNYCIQGSL